MSSLLLQICLIVLIMGTVKGQFKMAQHGHKCLTYDSPFEPMKVCDYAKGFDCRRKTKDGYVCDCYGTFIYDPVSQECRRQVGNSCQRARSLQILNEWPWNDKCQDNAECSQNGICTCKKGFILSRLNSCISSKNTKSIKILKKSFRF